MLTLEEAVAEAERVIKGNEDYVYPSTHGCVYYKEGEPSCLVGHILHNLGLINPELEGQERGKLDFDGLMESLGLMVEPEARDFLTTLQDFQDSTFSWGESLEKTKRGLKRQYSI